MRTSLMSTLELTCLVRTHKNAFFFTSTIEIVIYVQGRGGKARKAVFFTATRPAFGCKI